MCATPRRPHRIGRALRDDPSFRHEVKIVDDSQRFVHIVRDHDRGRAQRIVEPAYELADHAERDRVEPGERLVVHHQHRIECDRTRQRDPPRHSSRQFGRHQTRGAAQTDGMELHQHEIADQFLGKHSVLAHWKGNVLEHAHVGEQRTELEEHAEFTAQCVKRLGVEIGHRLPGDEHLAGLWPQLPADQSQYRRLAATAATHDGDDFPPRHGHRNASEHRPAVVGKRNVHQLDRRGIGIEMAGFGGRDGGAGVCDGRHRRGIFWPGREGNCNGFNRAPQRQTPSPQRFAPR